MAGTLTTKPAEQTRSLYRFEVNAEPGKPAQLLVEEETKHHSEVAIAGITTDEEAAVYLAAKSISAPLKQAFQEVLRRRKAIAVLAQESARLEDAGDEIVEEQGRIRQNMAQLDRTNDLYTRYVKKSPSRKRASKSCKRRPTSSKLSGTRRPRNSIATLRN